MAPWNGPNEFGGSCDENDNNEPSLFCLLGHLDTYEGMITSGLKSETVALDNKK